MSKSEAPRPSRLMAALRPPSPEPVEATEAVSAGPSSTNMAKTDAPEIVNLNFKIPTELRRTFKGVANDLDITAQELFERCFAFYCQQNENRYGPVSPALVRHAKDTREKF